MRLNLCPDPLPPPTEQQKRIMRLFAEGKSLLVISSLLETDRDTVKRELNEGCRRAGMITRGRAGEMRRLAIRAWFGENWEMSDIAFS